MLKENVLQRTIIESHCFKFDKKEKKIMATAYSLHFDSTQEEYKSTVNKATYFNSSKGG